MSHRNKNLFLVCRSIFSAEKQHRGELKNSQENGSSKLFKKQQQLLCGYCNFAEFRRILCSSIVRSSLRCATNPPLICKISTATSENRGLCPDHERSSVFVRPRWLAPSRRRYVVPRHVFSHCPSPPPAQQLTTTVCASAVETLRFDRHKEFSAATSPSAGDDAPC